MSNSAIPSLLLRASRLALPRSIFPPVSRSLFTLPESPHIYVFPNPDSINSYLLTLLPTPTSPSLAIGTTSAIPPTPSSLVENKRFLTLLQNVLKEHAHADPSVKSDAQAFASNAGSSLGSGGAFFPQQAKRRSGRGAGSGGVGAGVASSQRGLGGGGRGGHVHVSDERSPIEYGRIADPEDIFGSLEVDSKGGFVDETGNYQESGTYRIVTREGCLGLSPYLREKLVERLKDEERKLT